MGAKFSSSSNSAIFQKTRDTSSVTSSLTSKGKSKQQSGSTIDTRDLPYATLVTEDDRMNAVRMLTMIQFIVEYTNSDMNKKNHFAIKALFGGNYTEQVGKHINFDSPNTKVLDIGCGAGGWIMDMATEHPASHFTGVDKVSLFPKIIRPANVTFEQHDVTLGLPYKDNTFDFVQMRMFILAFNRNEWAECMKEVYRVTKPNGLVQLLEVEMVDDGDEVIRTLCAHIDNIMTANNQDAYIAKKLPTIITEGGFIPIEEVRKSIQLDNHPLASEFLYIFDITFDTTKSIAFAIYNISTEEEYQDIKRKWLESKKNSSHTTWWAAVGQKVVVVDQ